MTRAKLRVANKTNTIGQLNVAIRRLENARVAVYRDVVWKVFLRILKQTPQFSGAAVAHWTIGVGKPATFYDPNLGRRDLKLMRTMSGELRPLQRGNSYWIDHAIARERPKLQTIQRGSTVYITNGVLGEGGELYMEMLQDPAYAAKKLRDVNRPYEAVYDSVAVVLGKYWNKKINPFRVYVPDLEGDA